MKKLALAFAALFVTAAPGFAAPCVALDYQEMKDMSVNDLVAEACKASVLNDENFQNILTNLDKRGGPKPYPNADSDLEQCRGQTDRMLRILKSKGVTEKLPVLCQQQASGHTITAPAGSGSAAQPAG